MFERRDLIKIKFFVFYFLFLFLNYKKKLILKIKNKRKHIIMTEFVQRMIKPLCAFNKNIKYPVEVRNAGFMGDGVFATEDIKKGSVCCYYDGVIVESEIEAMFVTGKRGYSQFITQYGVTTKLMTGFPKQFREGGCSQIINDYNINYKQRDAPSNSQPLKNNKYSRGINVYTTASRPPYLGTAVTIALKNIKKGEQLFTSYGEGYWKAEKNATKVVGCGLFELTAEDVIRIGMKKAGNNLNDHQIDDLMCLCMWDNFELEGVRQRWKCYQKFFAGKVKMVDNGGNELPLIGNPD